MNEKIRILIVEDEPLHAAKLEILLGEMGFEVLKPIDNAAEALRVFQATKPDLVILDIDIKGKADGIDLANRLREGAGATVPVIFHTSANDEATFSRAKETSPFAYLLKPPDRYSLQHAIDLALLKAHANREQQTTRALETALQNGRNLFIKEQKKLYKVCVDDILVVEVDGRYCKIHTSERKLLVRSSLTQLMEKLPEDLFLQTHRNFLVNVNDIEEIDLEDAVARTSVKPVPISKNYKSLILSKLDFLK